MRYAVRTRTRAPSGIPTPKPTFNAEFDEDDDGSLALAADVGDVKRDVGFEVDADVLGPVEALLRLVFDAAAVFDVVEAEELDADVTPMVVRTLGVP